MLENLIKQSTEYLIRKSIISADNRDIYEYGFHSFYTNTLIFIIVGAISVVLKQLPQTIIFHIVFIGLRSVAGGYHAKTQGRCFFMSATIWVLSLFAICILSSSIFIIALSAISTLLIWIKAPIEHKNNPLGDYRHSKMKTYSRILSLVFLLSCIVLCILLKTTYMWIAAAFAVGMSAHSLLFVAEMFKKSDR